MCICKWPGHKNSNHISVNISDIIKRSGLFMQDHRDRSIIVKWKFLQYFFRKDLQGFCTQRGKNKELTHLITVIKNDRIWISICQFPQFCLDIQRHLKTVMVKFLCNLRNIIKFYHQCCHARKLSRGGDMWLCLKLSVQLTGKQCGIFTVFHE